MLRHPVPGAECPPVCVVDAPPLPPRGEKTKKKTRIDLDMHASFLVS